MFQIFKIRGKYKIFPLIILTFIPLVGGLLVSYLNKGSVVAYSLLDKPFFSPPPIVFMIVWPIIYLLMGLASYRIYMLRDLGVDVGSSLFFYVIQLLLNYLWFFIFFSFRLYGVSFILLIILLVIILITFIKFIKLDKLAGLLLIPYVLWVIFAGILNFFIWMKNEM